MLETGIEISHESFLELVLSTYPPGLGIQNVSHVWDRAPFCCYSFEFSILLQFLLRNIDSPSGL